jgi:hypothetical protein
VQDGTARSRDKSELSPEEMALENKDLHTTDRTPDSEDANGDTDIFARTSPAQRYAPRREVLTPRLFLHR